MLRSASSGGGGGGGARSCSVARAAFVAACLLALIPLLRLSYREGGRAPEYVAHLPRQPPGPPPQLAAQLRDRVALRAVAAQEQAEERARHARLARAGFSPTQVQDAMVDEGARRAALPGAMVLLHCGQTAALRSIVNDSLTLSFVREIVVWNNDPDAPLRADEVFGDDAVQFQADAAPDVAVAEGAAVTGTLTLAAAVGVPAAAVGMQWRAVLVNARWSLGEEARFRACALAHAPVCFMQDARWASIRYAEALFAAFVREPRLLHVAADVRTAYASALWTFGQEGTGLHAGWAWLGLGTVARRGAVAAFVAAAQERVASEAALQLLDSYFALWQNQVRAPAVPATHSWPLTCGTARARRCRRCCRCCPWTLLRRMALPRRSSPCFPRGMRHRCRPRSARWWMGCRHAAARTRELGRSAHTRARSAAWGVAAGAPRHPPRAPARHPHRRPRCLDHQRGCCGDASNVCARAGTCPHTRARACRSRPCQRASARGLPRSPGAEGHAYAAAVDASLATFWNAQRPVAPGDYFGLDLLAVQLVQEVYVVAYHQFQVRPCVAASRPQSAR